MIGLVTENHKVHLEINLDSVRKTRLHINPHLLQLCRVVGSPAKREKTNP